MIYFVQVGEDGPIKIGYTARNLKSRLSAIQVCCPYAIRLRAKIPDGTAREEMDLHRRFAHLIVRGEWFSPTPELEDFIGTLGDPGDVQPSGRRVATKCLGLRLALSMQSVRDTPLTGSQATARRHEEWRVAHDIGIYCGISKRVRRRTTAELAAIYRVTPQAIRDGVKRARLIREKIAELTAAE